MAKKTTLAPPPFTICIPIYDGVDFMDVAAPAEMFSWLKENWTERTVSIYIVAHEVRHIKTRDGSILVPHKSFKELPQADLVWTPGGDPKALEVLMYETTFFLDYLKQLSKTAQYTCSVCEGALLLAQAGLLDGYNATTHWAFIPCLQSYPNIKVVEGNPRYIIDRNRVTGGGISSGLDEALAIIQLLAGTEIARQVQLTTQYFPKPPVDIPIPPTSDCPVQSPIKKPTK